MQGYLARAPSDKVPMLKTVFLGYRGIPMGVLTVMRDLRKNDFRDLKPNEHSVEQLWPCFSELVSRELIPLAGEKIVHGDIRPGYDLTSNILFERKSGTMVLIDFESMRICPIPKALRGSMKDSRYPPHDESPWTYLWWQVLLVGFAWFKGVNMRSIGKLEYNWIYSKKRREFSESAGVVL